MLIGGSLPCLYSSTSHCERVKRNFEVFTTRPDLYLEFGAIHRELQERLRILSDVEWKGRQQISRRKCKLPKLMRRMLAAIKWLDHHMPNMLETTMWLLADTAPNTTYNRKWFLKGAKWIKNKLRSRVWVSISNSTIPRSVWPDSMKAIPIYIYRYFSR